MSFEIRDLPASLGAEAIGLRAEQIDTRDFERLRDAWERRSVLVLRDQRLTPAQQVEFSRRFGPLEIHIQRRFLLQDQPEILIVSNERRDGEPLGLGDAGKYWHSDLSYKAEPSLGSMLYAQILPAVGGDTLFADMHAAYDALDAETKARIDGLKAWHSYTARNKAQRALDPVTRPGLDAKQLAEVPDMLHPVVRVHPATGRRALFVNEGFTTAIEGLAQAESQALLAQLYAHMTEDRFLYRHAWRPGDMVMWDNRAVIHLATGCPPEMARTLHRTTVRGDRPVGIQDAAVAA